MSFYLLDHAQPVTQQWGYPRRGASLSGTCIIHTAECAMDFDGADSSAENCANFIRTRSDYGSYHTLVDSDSIIEMVPYEYEAWQDSNTNPWAVGLSCAVQADNWHLIPADRKDRIYRNLATAAADFVTYMKTKGITVPLRRISGQEARNRVPGFCAHGDSGVDRHDPGAQFDWNLFFTYTRQALGSAAIAPAGTTTKEDTLSAAEVKEIKDHINAVLIGGYEWNGKQHYGIAPVLEETQKRLGAVPAAVWATPVSRGGKKVPALQELADANTKVSGLAPAIAEIQANTDPAALADLIPDALAQQVIDKLAERLNGGK